MVLAYRAREGGRHMSLTAEGNVTYQSLALMLFTGLAICGSGQVPPLPHVCTFVFSPSQFFP